MIETERGVPQRFDHADLRVATWVHETTNATLESMVSLTTQMNPTTVRDLTDSHPPSPLSTALSTDEVSA